MVYSRNNNAQFPLIRVNSILVIDKVCYPYTLEFPDDCFSINYPFYNIQNIRSETKPVTSYILWFTIVENVKTKE